MALYALNLFDLAENDDYRAYARAATDAIARHGGSVVALGEFHEAIESSGVASRRAMILVEWQSPEGFDAFRSDPSLADLHRLRESGTDEYIWWTFQRLEDLRPLFADRPA